MNTYQYEVTLKVEVEAFDESDAWDAVQDAFGAGDTLGVNVIECEYKEARARKR
jgi:hypothetical protein